MTNLPRYKLGQKVKALRPLYFHSSKEEIPAGTIGEINGVGTDSQVGWYSVKFGKNENLLAIAPAIDPHCEIVN